MTAVAIASAEVLLGVITERGRCRGSGVDFFSDDKIVIERAKAICQTCPVLRDCRQYAEAANEQTGVWGGLSELERRPVSRFGPPCLSCGGILVPINEHLDECASCRQGWWR